MRILNRLKSSHLPQKLVSSLQVISEDDLFIKNMFNLPHLSPDDIRHWRYKGNYSWHQVPNFHTVIGNNIVDMNGFLANTPLKNYEILYLQIGALPPIFSIPTSIFIEFWEEILSFAIEAFTVASPDGKLVMEMCGRTETMYSNFAFE